MTDSTCDFCPVPLRVAVAWDDRHKACGEHHRLLGALVPPRVFKAASREEQRYMLGADR